MSAEEDVRSAAFQALLEIAVDASEDTEHRIAAAAVVLGNTTDPYEASDDEWTITVEPTEPVCSHDEWEMVWNNDVRRCKRCGHAEGIRVERS